MNTTTGSCLAELLARLTRCATQDPQNLSISALSDLVSQRQKLLDLIQGIDTSQLTARQQSALRSELESMQKATHAILSVLRERFAKIRNSRMHLEAARGAMRGYRPGMHRKSRTVNRTA